MITMKKLLTITDRSDGQDLHNKMINEAYKEIGFNIGIHQQHSDTFAPWISERFYKQIIKILNFYIIIAIRYIIVLNSLKL